MIFGKASSKVGDTFSLLDPKICCILKNEFMNLPHFLHDDFFAWLISFLTIFDFWILRSTAVVLVAFCNKANGPKSWNTPCKVNIYKLGVGPRLVPYSIYQSSASLFKNTELDHLVARLETCRITNCWSWSSDIWYCFKTSSTSIPCSNYSPSSTNNYSIFSFVINTPGWSI